MSGEATPRLAITCNLTMARTLAVLAMLVLFSFTSVATPSRAEPHQQAEPPLTRLARQLQDAPMPMRADFTWLALTQMAAFYTEEAARARQETRATPRARDTAQWAASVDVYANKIASLADTITTESVITVSVGISNEVLVYVDGQPVILTAAISNQQAAYEARVLERYCTLYICDDLFQEADYGEPALSAEYTGTDASTAYWSFSQHAGPVCMTNDGLEFQFLQLSDLAMKRAACSQAVAELSELAASLARALQQGARINWDVLEVHPAPPGTGNRVRIARQVEISLMAPLLADTPQLVKIVRPWLTARVRGESFQLVVLNAERMLGLTQATEPDARTQRYPAINSYNE